MKRILVLSLVVVPFTTLTFEGFNEKTNSPFTNLLNKCGESASESGILSYDDGYDDPFGFNPTYGFPLAPAWMDKMVPDHPKETISSSSGILKTLGQKAIEVTIAVIIESAVRGTVNYISEKKKEWDTRLPKEEVKTSSKNGKEDEGMLPFVDSLTGAQLRFLAQQEGSGGSDSTFFRGRYHTWLVDQGFIKNEYS